MRTSPMRTRPWFHLLLDSQQPEEHLIPTRRAIETPHRLYLAFPLCLASLLLPWDCTQPLDRALAHKLSSGSVFWGARATSVPCCGPGSWWETDPSSDSVTIEPCSDCYAAAFWGLHTPRLKASSPSEGAQCQQSRQLENRLASLLPGPQSSWLGHGKDGAMSVW